MSNQPASLNLLVEGLIADMAITRPQARDWSFEAADGPLAGASNTTVLGALRWLEGGEAHSFPVAIRIAPDRVSLFPAYDLGRQYLTISRLSRAGVNVPRLVGKFHEGSVEGRDAFVMERVEGRYLSDNPPYYQEGWLLDASPQVRRDIWLGGIDAMVSVNRVDWEAAGFADLWDRAAHASPLAQSLAQTEAHLDWAETLGRPYPKLRPLLDFLKANRPEQETIALCWGDAKPTNLMVANDGATIASLLDWEMVHLGNPVQDLAWWLILDTSMAEGIGLAKLEGVPSESELIERWQSASGFSLEQLDYYTGLSLLQFAIIMHRVGTLATQAGHFPPQMEYDRNNCVTGLLDAYLAKWSMPVA